MAVKPATLPLQTHVMDPIFETVHLQQCVARLDEEEKDLESKTSVSKSLIEKLVLLGSGLINVSFSVKEGIKVQLDTFHEKCDVLFDPQSQQLIERSITLEKEKGEILEKIAMAKNRLLSSTGVCNEAKKTLLNREIQEISSEIELLTKVKEENKQRQEDAKGRIAFAQETTLQAKEARETMKQLDEKWAILACNYQSIGCDAKLVQEKGEKGLSSNLLCAQENLKKAKAKLNDYEKCVEGRKLTFQELEPKLPISS